MNDLICKRSECESCCMKFKKNNVLDVCFALVRDTDKEFCPFYKTKDKMIKELKNCYNKMCNPIIHSYDDYIDFLNDALTTKFYNQFKEDKYSG